MPAATHLSRLRGHDSPLVRKVRGLDPWARVDADVRREPAHDMVLGPAPRVVRIEPSDDDAHHLAASAACLCRSLVLRHVSDALRA